MKTYKIREELWSPYLHCSDNLEYINFIIHFNFLENQTEGNKQTTSVTTIPLNYDKNIT